MENLGTKMYACSFDGCSSVFDRRYRLEQHSYTHREIKPFVCTEENCDKSYTNKSHLDRHINSVHKKSSRDIIYSCPECMKQYANRQNLKRHIKRDHINISNSFLCDICKRKFKKKNQLTAHMFLHNGIKAYKCDICPSDFVSLYEKKKHMRNHKTYECELCSLKFVNWSQCVKHRRSAHITKEFICDDCGKKFRKKTHIVRHVKTHSQTLARTFQCPFENCERRYSRNSNLKQHIIIKHVRITHECTICGAELCSKATLQKHVMKLHNGEAPTPRVPKTLQTGRKFRKDKNSFRFEAALKISGLQTKPEANDAEKSVPNDNEMLIE